MDGPEFVRRMRQRPCVGKVLVFSSELTPEMREAYLGLGFEHVLAKPVLPTELRRLLAGMFPTPADPA